MKKRMKKQISCILISTMLVFGLSGCVSSETKNTLPIGAAENDILTVTPVNQEKELVTIHYEYGQVNKEQIEETIEEKFPDIDVVMVHDGATNSAIALRDKLEHGMEADIILSRVMQQINDIAPESLLDLSGEEFVNNYYLTALDACVIQDGGLYYLPGPSDVYGVIYNKTMFEENGWQVPHSYSEFVELIHTIDHSGLTAVENFDGEKEVPLRAVRPSLYFSDAFQLLLHSFAYDKVFAGKDNLEWLTAYQHGDGSMVGHMEPYADTVKKLVDDGILRLEDWDFKPRFRSDMMYLYHSTAMIFETQSAYDNNLQYAGEEADEIGMLPFWTGDEPDSDYLYAMPSYFMAINKASADIGPERKQLLIDIVGYLSTPEAQLKIFGSGMQISSVKNVPVNSNDFTKEIQKTVEEGRVISNFYFLDGGTSRSVETKMNDTVRDMLTGRITVEEWLQGADETRDECLAGVKKENKVYGTCEDNLTSFEVALVMGEMYRAVTGADIALVYVNKKEQGVNCNMYAGDIDDVVLNNIAPDRISEEGEGVAYATMTGQQITDSLAGAKYDDDTIPDWYFVASGLNVEYAPWNKSGERLISCTLPDGSELNPEERYKVAFFSDKLPDVNTKGNSSLQLSDTKIIEKKWRDLFIEYIDSQGSVIKAPEQTTILNWDLKE